MPGDTFLFTPPLGIQPEPAAHYTNQCYQNDIDGLLELIGAVADEIIFAADLAERFVVLPSEIPEVVLAVTRLFSENGFDHPGPFKKTAALTIALASHPLLVYKDSGTPNLDPILKHKLPVVIAIRTSQVYVTKAFRNAHGHDIVPPQFPSSHFKQDFIAHLLNVDPDPAKALMSVSLIWELLTYMSNASNPNKIQGIIDNECDRGRYNLPGIDISFADLPQSGWT